MATYRYWRLETGANPSSGFFAMAELAMRTTVGGSNALSGATLSASSTSGGFPLSNLTDGNTGTFWVSTNSGSVHSVTADFGSATEIRQIDITTRFDGNGKITMPSSLKVQVSTDGSTFVPLTTINQQWDERSAYNFYLPGFAPTLPGTTYRYWRLDLVSSGAIAACNKLEFRTSIGGANTISGGTLTASTSFNGSFLPANTQDNDDTTRWVSQSTVAQPQFLKVDFGSGNEKAIREVLFRTLSTGNGWDPVLALPQQINMYVSSDDSTYVPVVQFFRTMASYAANTSYTFDLAAGDTLADESPPSATARRRRFAGIVG